MNISSLIKAINMSNILKSTSNTLNVVKKIIPVYKEIRPFLNKEKTIFKNEKESNKITNQDDNYNDSLTFFN